jgi:hypothetical protein
LRRTTPLSRPRGPEAVVVLTPRSPTAAVGIIAGNAIVLLFWTIVNYFYPIPQVLIIE